MNVRELVMREVELSRMIDFNIEEMKCMSDLAGLEKYRGSKTLQERFDRIDKETSEMLKEFQEVNFAINEIEDIVGLAKEIEEEFEAKEIVTDEDLELLEHLNHFLKVAEYKTGCKNK